MANRHTLAITKIDDFRDWLIKDGWEIKPVTECSCEVLRATKTGRRHPLIIYKRNNAKEHLSVLDRDMGVIKAYMRDARKKIQLYTYEHRGYILQQSSYNWHYFIFDGKTEQAVLHAQCTSKLTEEEARERIDGYLKLIGEWGNHEKGGEPDA
jgi:hypothetical protein